MVSTVVTDMLTMPDMNCFATIPTTKDTKSTKKESRKDWTCPTGVDHRLYLPRESRGTIDAYP